MNEYLKFFIYSRKSVFTGKGESIENQIEMCRKYIFTKFPRTKESDISIYEDEGFSAKNTDRPEFQRMIRDIKTQKPDFIVCYRLDRISRNVSDFSSLIEDLNNREISFVCINEEFDTSKPMGKAMMYIASVFAQLERETIAERVRDNMFMLARTGRWLGGTPPTGFSSAKIQEVIIDGKSKSSCMLVDNPDELYAVDIMFEKYLEYRSISAVSKYLIDKNIKSRKGSYYSLLGIKQILQNPVYCIGDKNAYNFFISNNADVSFNENECSDKCGLMAYNKRVYSKKSNPRQPIDKWIVAMGKHKGRVSGKKWVAVQNIIESNIPTGKKPSKMHNDYSLLSGLIVCEKCGSRMFAKQRRSKNRDTDLYDYICSNKMRGGTSLCNCPNISGMLADDTVCEHLTEYTCETSEIYKYLESLKSEIKKNKKENPVDLINEKIKKINSEIDNLLSTLSENKLAHSIIMRINDKIETLEKELADLENERKTFEKNQFDFSEKELQIDIYVNALSNLKTNFKKLSVYDKRNLIRLLVSKIIWDGKELHIFISDK